MKCWEKRGCPEEMEKGCPFALADTYCELHCEFLYCPKGRPDFTMNFGSIFNTDQFSHNVKKEGCLFCEVFIKYANKDKENDDNE